MLAYLFINYSISLFINLKLSSKLKVNNYLQNQNKEISKKTLFKN
jgi:hypothetical protein